MLAAAFAEHDHSSSSTNDEAANMRVPMLKSSLLVAVAASFAGCASGGGKPAASVKTSTSTQQVPADLAPGEQIDYAGHRCGNPNLYVKTHLCVFPRR